MPEGPELESEALKETIDKEIERHEEPFLRWIALATAILATLAALASLKAGGTVNEGLVLKTEATRLQAQASDQWAYYQAKGIKVYVARATAAAWQAAGKPVPPAVDSVMTKEAHDQKMIQDTARALERARDRASEDADHLLDVHHGFANAVTLFQVAVALASVAALTKSRPIWWVSLVLGAAGIVFAVVYWARL
jgi:hypothetical protein